MGYDKAKIYKLVNDTLGLTYYGCTINTLRQRLNGHKNKGNKCSSKILFEGEGQVKIYLVEEYPTDNRDLLKMRERWYIENNECVNIGTPGRTGKEYRLTIKDQTKEYNKQYRILNKVKLKEQKEQYYENNKDKIKEYKKQYRNNNKDKIKEQKKQYYEKNKDIISERNRQKYKDHKL
jgi:hypothetical protein